MKFNAMHMIPVVYKSSGYQNLKTEEKGNRKVYIVIFIETFQSYISQHCRIQEKNQLTYLILKWS